METLSIRTSEEASKNTQLAFDQLVLGRIRGIFGWFSWAETAQVALRSKN